jgi:hypothetical protein
MRSESLSSGLAVGFVAFIAGKATGRVRLTRQMQRVTAQDIRLHGWQSRFFLKRRSRPQTASIQSADCKHSQMAGESGKAG